MLCVSSIELFRDTLLRVTTGTGVVKCLVKIILVAFTIKAREKPTKGKVLYEKGQVVINYLRGCPRKNR